MSAETRKLVVSMLKQKPMTVNELIVATGLTKAGVQYHLEALKPRLTVTKRMGLSKRMRPTITNQYQIIEGTRK
jgi:DNA-binding transcriptional ArsR family regulator